jgi:hypothetical protein
LKTLQDYARLGTSVMTALTLGVVLMFVAVPRSQAADRAECQQRIEKSEAKLHEAIRKHGERSQQADHWRRELNEERERCWNQHHGWWNARERQWHNDRDWDGDRDWDRDRDHGRGGYGSNPAYQSGYNEGLRIGRYDRRVNRPYQPGNYKAYKQGDQAYRSGFVEGYDEGFGRRR